MRFTWQIQATLSNQALFRSLIHLEDVHGWMHIHKHEVLILRPFITFANIQLFYALYFGSSGPFQMSKNMWNIELLSRLPSIPPVVLQNNLPNYLSVNPVYFLNLGHDCLHEYKVQGLKRAAHMDILTPEFVIF
jgi:hypothetical protein